MNLIPSGVVRARRRSRRIRRWSVATAVAAGLAAVPVLLQLQQHARLADLLERKQTATAQAAGVQAELVTASRSLGQLRDAAERANTLRTRRPWAGLLTRIVDCMPGEVWLVSMKTEAPQTDGAAQRTPRVAQPRAESGERPAPADKVVTLAGARRLDLTGFAVDHEQLYEFMARLKHSETFELVELVRAGMQPVLRSRGVRFELTCTW